MPDIFELSEFANLYKDCPHLRDCKNMNEYKDFHAFSKKKGLPVAIGSFSKHMEVIPKIERYYPFFQRNKIFLLIPIDLPNGEIVGMVMKGLETKDYNEVLFNDFILLGMSELGKMKYGQPLILVEGSRDSIFLQQFFSNTLALLTSNISTKQMNFIKGVTNRVIMSFDNDTYGIKNAKNNAKKLIANGICVSNYVTQLKDWGSYFTSDSTTVLTELSRLKLTIKAACYQ